MPSSTRAFLLPPALTERQPDDRDRARLRRPDPSEDDAEHLRLTIAGLYRGAAESRLIGRLVLNELNRDTERLDYLCERFIMPTLRSMMPGIERLVASGRMAPTPMDLLFFAIIGPIGGVADLPLARRLGRPEPDSPEQIAAAADSLAALVVHGLLDSGSRRGS